MSNNASQRLAPSQESLALNHNRPLVIIQKRLLYDSIVYIVMQSLTAIRNGRNFSRSCILI
jgi:hypothetical protein